MSTQLIYNNFIVNFNVILIYNARAIYSIRYYSLQSCFITADLPRTTDTKRVSSYKTTSLCKCLWNTRLLLTTGDNSSERSTSRRARTPSTLCRADHIYTVTDRIGSANLRWRITIIDFDASLRRLSVTQYSSRRHIRRYAIAQSNAFAYTHREAIMRRGHIKNEWHELISMKLLCIFILLYISSTLVRRKKSRLAQFNRSEMFTCQF